MLRLQILQLLHQLVELGIANLWMVEDVIQVFVVADLLPQRFDLFFDVFPSGSHRKDYRRTGIACTLPCRTLRYNPASIRPCVRRLYSITLTPAAAVCGARPSWNPCWGCSAPPASKPTSSSRTPLLTRRSRRGKP